MPEEYRTQAAGPAVDRTGSPVTDPTQNVLDLVAAAIRRLDDLREVESRHIRELAGLRGVYEEKLAEKETQRIDAIRAVDVSAVSRAAEVSAAQASTLASQVQASAEALRTQVEAARIATETRLASSLAPITKSIEDLRAAQYAQQGEKLARTDTRSGSAVYLQLISVLIAVGSLVLVIVIALGKSKG